MFVLFAWSHPVGSRYFTLQVYLGDRFLGPVQGLWQPELQVDLQIISIFILSCFAFFLSSFFFFISFFFCNVEWSSLRCFQFIRVLTYRVPLVSFYGYIHRSFRICMLLCSRNYLHEKDSRWLTSIICLGIFFHCNYFFISFSHLLTFLFVCFSFLERFFLGIFFFSIVFLLTEKIWTLWSAYSFDTIQSLSNSCKWEWSQVRIYFTDYLVCECIGCVLSLTLSPSHLPARCVFSLKIRDPRYTRYYSRFHVEIEFLWIRIFSAFIPSPFCSQC